MGAVTILTWSVLSPDEIGYILCTDQSQRSSQFLYPAAAPASSSATSAVPQQEAVGDVGMPEPQAVPEDNPEIALSLENCKFTFSTDLHFWKNLHSKFT